MAADVLIDRAVGGQRPADHRERPAGAAAGGSSGRIAPLAAGAAAAISPMVGPLTVPGVRLEQPGQLAQQGRQPAGGVEVLHEAGTGRLDVGEHRHAGAEPGQLIQGQGDADPARDRRQVDHRVGGAADRVQHPDRVGEGGGGQQHRGRQARR